MPKHRPDREIWVMLRKKVWQRDGGRCQGPYCQNAPPLSLNKCQIDHIQSGPLANNSLNNLRVLCRRCHVLRLDQRHRGLIGSALRDGIIPTDWRRFTWDDNSLPSTQIVEEMERWVIAQKESFSR